MQIGSDEMVVRLLGNVFLALGVLFVVLVFVPGLPPHDVAFVDHPEDTPVSSEGPWAKNDLLDSHQLLSSSVEGATLGYLKVTTNYDMRHIFTHRMDAAVFTFRVQSLSRRTTGIFTVGFREATSCGCPLRIPSWDSGNLSRSWDKRARDSTRRKSAVAC